MENEKLENFNVEQLPTNKHLEDILPPIKRIKDCEWCFQFDNEEPRIFAWTNEDDVDENPTVTFTITNTEDSYITFSKDGRVFKLFARPLTDEGKALREERVKFEATQQNLENESTNKEA